jgi:hypothetical protein
VSNCEQLRRLLAGYVAYYMRSRTHLALSKDCSMESRSAKPEEQTSAPMVWRASTVPGCFDWLLARRGAATC